MDVFGRSQLNYVVRSYIGKRIMIVVPSQSIGKVIDAETRANHLSLNRQIICRSDANNQVVIGVVIIFMDLLEMKLLVWSSSVGVLID